MATPALLPDDESVYRGLSNANWSRAGRITYRAFLLRRANDKFHAEKEVSLGRTSQSAVDELRENHGIAQLSVREVHSLPHGLAVRPDPANATKAYLFGLPLYSTEKEQRDLAMTVANDLASISSLVAAASP